ncbi:Uncharacterised protein [Mycobacteroides abscessus subsp. abscessus]|nr:Uncharacterised protein [Mycobacteroides abscessus subsp. abscessus]
MPYFRCLCGTASRLCSTTSAGIWPKCVIRRVETSGSRYGEIAGFPSVQASHRGVM